MEIWGYCDGCQRWFYCPRWFDPEEPQPVCPVCWREPVAIENRELVTWDEDWARPGNR